MKQGEIAAAVVAAARELSHRAEAIDATHAVPWVYNPLDYAWEPHRQYLTKYARPTCRVLFLGMNPGPWGMAQTGVPFGEVEAVSNWLGIRGAVRRPAREHPKRPIEGFDCPRSEVSGRRLWGLFRQRFGEADRFFQHHFVANYCPLVFMEASGRNLTPDKLPLPVRRRLEEICDAHLQRLVQILRPRWLIGIGAFAETCARRACRDVPGEAVKIGRILHPSPASPAANRDWSGTVERQMEELGIWS
ncbi:MAG: single-strand selective monofunctional uracil DNA glycosylase [Pirellulaceae bacterium]|nr:MAG: single-strand selective monofunctional uracil DNA glycosylase [Pirellulaceae bacterium]